MLETAHINLGDVAANVLGASGRAMPSWWPASVMPSNSRAWRGDNCGRRTPSSGKRWFTEHHAFMLQSLLNHTEFLEQQIQLFDRRIEVEARPFALALERLDTNTGVARRSAEQILAELGDDMTRFPTAAHAPSWAGVGPGQPRERRETQSGKTRKSGPRAATSRRNSVAWPGAG